MNPREFCSKRGFPVAIFLTFNFDPIFFERVILRDLELGETEDILVIADQGQVFSSIERWKDQVLHLGRKYQLIPTKINNTFHPKLILRCGLDQTGIWLGSGNVSFGGWGGNQELAISWFSENQSKEHLVISEMFKNLQTAIPDSSSIDVISRVRNYLSANQTNSDSLKFEDSPILFSQDAKSLSGILLSKWQGRKFRKVTIFTGSTDENGAFLKWLNLNFGIEEAVILVDQNHVSFSAAKLSTLPLKITLKSLPGKKPLHAKFYWFEGDEGCAAVIGSANCSAAAWLVSPSNGGNYETIAVFDEADSNDFRHILSKLDDDLIDTVLTERVSELKIKTSIPKFGIPEVVWDASTGLLTVSFPWINEQITNLETLIGDEVINFELKSGFWQSTRNVIHSDNKTKFLDFTITLADGTIATFIGWINDLFALRQSSKVRKITDALSRFGDGQPSSEHDKMMTDLQKISQLLLEGREQFPDHVVTIQDKTNQTDDEQNLNQINPDDFIKSISEITESKQESLIRFGETGGLSISAILRTFFGIKDDVPDIADEEEDDENLSPSLHNETNRSPRISETPNERNQKRFQKMIEQFLKRLTDNEFANGCNLLQLKNAIIYSLATCSFGHRNNWLDSQTASEFIKRTFDIIFRKRFGEENGLLEAVKKRYRDDSQESFFIKEIGDGELWTVLLASIVKTNWDFSNGSFEKKLALRSVFNSKVLFESVNVGRLTDLFFRIEEEERNHLINESLQAGLNFELLENELKLRQSELAFLQQTNSLLFESGDLIWIKGGWAQVIETANWGENTIVYHHAKGEQIKVKTNVFLNVSKLSQIDPTINSLFAKVRENNGLDSSL